jgi:hypothetical protein
VLSSGLTSTQFKYLSSKTGTANADDEILPAVISRDLLNPLGNYASAYRNNATVVPLGTISMSKSGDGGSSSFGFTVYQDVTPSTGPWWASLPDNARVRMTRNSTGTAPQSDESDVVFKGLVGQVTAGINESGQGNTCEVSVDESNSILGGITIKGTPSIRTINVYKSVATGAYFGIRRSSNSVIVTTTRDHPFKTTAPYNKVRIKNALGGGTAGYSEKDFTISAVGLNRIEFPQTGANDTQNSTIKVASVTTVPNVQRISVTFDERPNILPQMAGSLSACKFNFSQNIDFVGGATLQGWLKENDWYATAASGTALTAIFHTAGPARPQKPGGGAYANGTSFPSTLGRIYTQPSIDLSAPLGVGDIEIGTKVTEDGAVKLILSTGVDGINSSDYSLQRIIDTSDESGISGSSLTPKSALRINGGSLQSALDSLVEEFSGNDGKERRYWISNDKKLNYELSDPGSAPANATAPLKIIVSGAENPYANPGTIFPAQLQATIHHSDIVKRIIVTPGQAIVGEDGVREYTDDGIEYTKRSGPILQASVNAPLAKDKSGVTTAAKAFFLENAKTILSGSFVLHGCGTAAYNQYGWQGGYSDAGTLTYSWEPNQWVSIEAPSLNLTGIYRVETVDVTFEEGSYIQNITVGFARRSVGTLTSKLKGL